MDIYFFVKYNNETNFEHIQKYAETNATLCFDFEDSIKNWMNPASDSELKSQHRAFFKSIYNNLLSRLGPVKIAIRINSYLPELEKDILAISTFRINSILIPKVETPEQIKFVEHLLIENEVFYDELLPVIESPQGLANLQEIIRSSPQKIRKIGFGHCDYNLNINTFPFFHQDSNEYWKWIDKIGSITIPQNIKVMNSPWLALENTSFFEAMLIHLDELFGENFGQFTLTTRQTDICNIFKLQKKQDSFGKLLSNRLDLNVTEQMAFELINKFESENNNRGFTVSKAEGILISPQEYLSAKAYLAKRDSGKINFTYVGGCFPVQHNVLFEDLFHQKLKKKLEYQHQIKLNINIIRYERFNSCLSKIATYQKSNPVDILAFHIRPEPFLRLVKFYYKYVDNNGKLKHSFNIPLFKSINPEKYDFLVLGRTFEMTAKQNDSGFHKMMVDMNYKTGNFFGNKKYALEKYFVLVSDVINYCRNIGIKLVIIGPATRSNTSLEPALCRELDDYFKKRLKDKDITYIDGLERFSALLEPYFHSNGIHATERYHELIAGRLYDAIEKELIV
jgi:citrate lyase beta subunit